MRSSHPGTFTPRKLVAVGLDGKPVRLVPGHTAGGGGRHTALGYCWGKSSQLQTTRQDLARFSREIPFERLPKTFLDAIITVRALEIRYI